MFHIRRRWKALLAIGLPLVAVGASFAFIAANHQDASTAVVGSAADEPLTTVATSAPDRGVLIAIAKEKAATLGDTSPTRLQFVETTHGKIKAHFDSANPADNEEAPVVAMVVYGAFEEVVPTGLAPGPGEPPPTKTIHSTAMEVSVDLSTMRADSWMMVAPNRPPMDLSALGSVVQDVTLS